MKILIVEDEDLFADNLVRIIENLGYECIGPISNSDEVILKLNEVSPDLIILDIGIEGSMDGIELAEKIDSIYRIPYLYLTSVLDDQTFARARISNPLNFLVKPIGDLQLRRAIESCIFHVDQVHQKDEKIESVEFTNLRSQSTFKENIFIKSRNKLEKVSLSDVLYLEADGHYTKIATISKKYLVRIPLSELCTRMPEELFIRTHRSFVVNIKNVESINLEDNTVIFQTIQVPLSKRNRETVLNLLNWI